MIKDCNSSPEIKAELIKNVPLFSGWSEKDLSSLTCDVVVIEAENFKAIQKDRIATAKATLNRTLPLRDQTTDLIANDFYKDFLQNRKDELQCLDSVGLTKLWCYRVFTLVDPTLAVLFVAKAPALIKAFSTVVQSATRAPKPPIEAVRAALTNAGLFEINTAKNSAVPVINTSPKNAGMSGMVRNHIKQMKPFKIGDDEFVVKFVVVSDNNNGAVNIIYMQNTKTGQVVYTAVPPGHETANAFAIQQAQSILKTGVIPP